MKSYNVLAASAATAGILGLPFAQEAVDNGVQSFEYAQRDDVTHLDGIEGEWLQTYNSGPQAIFNGEATLTMAVYGKVEDLVDGNRNEALLSGGITILLEAAAVAGLMRANRKRDQAQSV